ncbi:hypothetical protein [Lentzea sp. NBRC 102530]|uniref:hypothetical protein n=1 Tax=Lentzea sp. NBRC 102530 TaxID=3032201 RepID=UPI0024A2193F|nr:hypothetical protein [Lentzea sp. NBRC 102530]GLY46839.1 hypothetical protein Lesp01_04950 [Lentzea sp. NBRC 102530]
MATHSAIAARSSARWYREKMAWDTRKADNAVHLHLGSGTVAFDVPGDRMIHVHELLLRHDVSTPVMTVTSALEVRGVFLAEADGGVLGQFQMPVGVSYLTCPGVVELPLLDRLGQHRKWFVAPDPESRWLFPASAVLDAIIAATRPSSRPRWRAERPAPRQLIG